MIFLNPHPSVVKNVPEILKNRDGSAVYVSEASVAICNDNPQPAEIPSVKSPEPIVHHPEFFFDNTLIAIQIENTLFNVHKYQLSKSEFFSEIFKVSNPRSDKPKEGSSPEHPIVIDGAAASDFAALLRVLYASRFSSDQLAPEGSLIIPAFRLANLLSFSDLRTYLLPLAEKNLDDVDKIVFAREFDIKEWLAPAHIRLCKRDAVLNTEEANKLGINSVLLIWRMREQHRSIATNTGELICYNCTGLECYAHGGGYYCKQCGSNSNATLRCRGPGAVETKVNTNDSAIEEEVTKWVEDGHAMKD